MQTNTIHIPFESYGKKGLIEVTYGENTSPILSGFEIVKDLVPDLSICMGYPTMHAKFKEFEGHGFTKASAVVQIITMDIYNTVESTSPDKIIKIVDLSPTMQQNNVPFFAYGYPAEIYDAPCNNYTSSYKLVWKAETYFTSYPSFVNNHEISFLAGFNWGFVELNQNDNKTIEVSPIEVLAQENWNDQIDFLVNQFNSWHFV